jgi:predicted permease
MRAGMGMVLAAGAVGAFHPPNQLFMLVLFTLHAMPTALNMSTVASLHRNGEEEVGALLFWQYLACTITIPCFLVLFTVILG